MGITWRYGSSPFGSFLPLYLAPSAVAEIAEILCLSVLAISLGLSWVLAAHDRPPLSVTLF